MIENTLVAGAVLMKGPAGVLIPLGIELFVDTATTMYLYNLISVAIILFIASMSGPRSEAAFCIVVPIFAGIMEMFGWLRLATSSETLSLYILTVIMGLFGVFIYMNEQNKQTYGTYGPGSKMFNIAFFLVCFTASLTLISSLSIFPVGSTQPVPGTCAVGFTCDTYHNIDFNSNFQSIQKTGGVDVDILSAASGLINIGFSCVILILKIFIGVIAFPVILNSVLNGIFPGIETNAIYLVFLAVIEVVILSVYALGLYELFWKPAGGVSTL